MSRGRRVFPLIATGLVVVPGHLQAQRLPIHPPVHVQLSNAWNPVDRPPVLRLSLVTATTYPNNGYCIRTQTRSDADSLLITLQGVDQCRNRIGEVVSPAAAAVDLEQRPDGSRLSITITANGIPDRLTVHWVPGIVLLEPDAEPQVTVIATLAGVSSRSPPNPASSAARRPAFPTIPATRSIAWCRADSAGKKYPTPWAWTSWPIART